MGATYTCFGHSSTVAGNQSLSPRMRSSTFHISHFKFVKFKMLSWMRDAKICFVGADTPSACLFSCRTGTSCAIVTQVRSSVITGFLILSPSGRKLARHSVRNGGAHPSSRRIHSGSGRSDSSPAVHSMLCSDRLRQQIFRRGFPAVCRQHNDQRGPDQDAPRQ